MSVDPVTATLPVIPVSIHSGVAPFAGAAVGHMSSGTAWVAEEVAAPDGDDWLAGAATDDVSGAVSDLDPHAESAKAIDAVQATVAMEEGR